MPGTRMRSRHSVERGRRGVPQPVRRLGSERLRQRRQIQRAGRLHRSLPAVHAGEGEDAGGGAQGADAIWSHRWYVNPTDFGLTGPSAEARFGGAQIGESKYWIGDYTVEAENGGLGVFAHEFAHDLGLPDFYDTNAGENGTAFWTLMSSGSWIGDGTEDIGTKPDYMGPWEKLQLGWLDYSVSRRVAAATSASIRPKR